MISLRLTNSKSERMYNVDLTLTHVETHTTHHEVSVKVESMSLSGYTLRVIKHSSIGKKGQDPIQEMFAKAAEPVNELIIIMSDRGEIKDIKNYKEILKQWGYVRQCIEHGYESEFISPIMDAMEKNIRDKQLLINSLYRDPFFYYYFHGLYAQYRNNSPVTRKNVLYDYNGKDYNIDESLQVFSSENKTVSLKLNGQYKDENTSIAITGNYYFDKQHYIKNARIRLDANINKIPSSMQLTIQQLSK